MESLGLKELRTVFFLLDFFNHPTFWNLFLFAHVIDWLVEWLTDRPTDRLTDEFILQSFFSNFQNFLLFTVEFV